MTFAAPAAEAGLSAATLVDSIFGPGAFREIVVNFDEVAASWLARQRHEARRTGDPRLEALIDRAQRLIGPLPRREFSDDEPVVCSRLRIGDQVLALYTVVVRFDTATDVTLNELRVELLHPANTAAERFFGIEGLSLIPEGSPRFGLRPPGSRPLRRSLRR